VVLLVDGQIRRLKRRQSTRVVHFTDEVNDC